jgi:hypothetical protein
MMALAVALAAVLSVPGCGEDGPAGDRDGTASPSTDDGSGTTVDLTGSRPPQSARALISLYRDELAALGLELTDRGGLIDRSGGGYDPSASGEHLALYLEPTGERSTAEYVEGVVTATKVFVPDVFERWPALESFDVCQEPPASRDPNPEPAPVTQIELTRDQAEAIAWDEVTLAQLLERSTSDPPGLRLLVADELHDDPTYRAALEESSGS